MDLMTIEMERPKARQLFLEYRRAISTGLGSLEDKEIMRGYRELAAGKQLIHLPDTIRASGVGAITVRRWRFNEGAREVTVTVPRLAVAHADATFVWTPGVNEQGVCAMRDKESIGSSNVKNRFRFEGLGEGTRDPDAWDEASARIRALVPPVPLPFRPTRGLGNYHVLFEAEWKDGPAPPAPYDPALLRHIGGDLYAVVAVWDLTDLERAILGGS